MRMKNGTKKYMLVGGIVVGLFVAAAFLSLCWGSFEISVPQVIQVLLGNGTKMQNTAVFTIRLPRILVGIFVAAALAISGGILQTMTKILWQTRESSESTPGERWLPCCISSYRPILITAN